MLLITVIGGPLTFSWDALALFLVTTAVTICAGHSVGMHRLFIHRSFSAPKWLERTLVYLGTLVGMAGPFSIIAVHEIRDWAQRQRECHDLFAHRTNFLRDAWWQLHGTIELDHPPRLVIENSIKNDRFYRFIERTWMLQQLPWAILFYMLGGIGWVIWGIAARITFSLHGHWLVVHFTHRMGRQDWIVDGAAVQAFNISKISLITFGESFHGNHHAFPSSARLGLDKGDLDPGWWLIRILEFVGLAWDVKQPEHVGFQKGLRRIATGKARYPKKLSLFAAWVAATIVGTLTAQFLALLTFGGPAAPWAETGSLMMNIGAIAALMMLISVVPAIRIRSVDAETDSKHGLDYYAQVGASHGVLWSLPAPFLMIFLLPSATVAGLVFGIFNRLAIRKFLAEQPKAIAQA